MAYADFVTAMMAFFLVMWLVTAVSKEQRAAIFDYFKNPSMEPGKSVKPAPGQMGPGGASTSPINLGGGLDAPRTIQSEKPGIGTPVALVNRAKPAPQLTPAERSGGGSEDQSRVAQAQEKKQLECADAGPEGGHRARARRWSRSRISCCSTSRPEGLRIQIVDAQNRPMFDLGSSRLKGYTNTILRELTPYLNSVPNRISLTGHTDVTPYAGITGYTNWDLSTDRANAARRALERAGLSTDKVARVVGLSSVRAVRQGESAQPDQSPHQHHRDDAARPSRTRSRPKPRGSRRDRPRRQDRRRLRLPRGGGGPSGNCGAESVISNQGAL